MNSAWKDFEYILRTLNLKFCLCPALHTAEWKFRDCRLTIFLGKNQAVFEKCFKIRKKRGENLVTHCWLRAFTCTLHASNTRCEEQVEPLGWGRRMRPQGRGVGGRGERGEGGSGRGWNPRDSGGGGESGGQFSVAVQPVRSVILHLPGPH